MPLIPVHKNLAAADLRGNSARLVWLLALIGGVRAWIAHRDEGISFRVQSREARSQNAIICIRQLHLIMEVDVVEVQHQFCCGLVTSSIIGDIDREIYRYFLGHRPVQRSNNFAVSTVVGGLDKASQSRE